MKLSILYITATRNILAILIPIGYWVAGIALLFALSPTRKDLAHQAVAFEDSTGEAISRKRVAAFVLFVVVVLASLTVGLLVAGLVVN